MGDQAGFQILTLAVTLAIAIFGGLFTGKVMNQVAPQKTYGDDEEAWGMEFSDEEAQQICA